MKRLLSILCLVTVVGCGLKTAILNPGFPAGTVAQAIASVVVQIIPQAKTNQAFKDEVAKLQDQIAAGNSDVVLAVFNDPNGPLAKSGGQIYAAIWTELPLALALIPQTSGDQAAYFALERAVTIGIVKGLVSGLGIPINPLA